MCVFAYAAALVVYQFGSLAAGNVNILGVIVAAAILAGVLYQLFRPYKESQKLTVK